MSDDDDPEHEYEASGTYQVTLTVTDDDGATSSLTQQVRVSEAESVNQAPVATIGSIICTGMTCTFTGDSTDPGGNETIAEWNWIVGDGESSTGRNPVHAYSSPDDHDVELRVTDNGGLSATDSEEVTVAVEGGGDGEG
jgi:PKD repeat protein